MTKKELFDSLNTALHHHSGYLTSLMIAKDTELLTAYASRVNLAEKELLSLLTGYGIDPQQVAFRYDISDSDRYQASFPFPKE